jgi:hypothetical protein
MSETPHDLADRLGNEGGRVVDYFDELNPEQWKIHIYPGLGNWTLHELLAHFVSAEIGRLRLIHNVCEGAGGAPIGFNIDAYNEIEVQRLSVQSNTNLLNRFKIERESLVDFVSSLTDQKLNLLGTDPFLGTATVREMVKLTYRHNQIHLREIRQYL